MNRNRLKFSLALAATLVLSGCGEAVQQADAGNSTSAAAASNVNATNPAVAGTYLITDVWVNRDGIWQVVSRHASLLTTKK